MSEVVQALKENDFKPRLLYPANLLFIIEGEIKAFHDKQKQKQFMTLNHHARRSLRESCIQKMKVNITMKGWVRRPHHMSK
jgi:hypothetical protein